MILMVQTERDKSEVEVRSLRRKFETLEKSYNTIKKTRRKKLKAQAQTLLENAEAETVTLNKRLEEVEMEYGEAKEQLAVSTNSFREREQRLMDTNAELERTVAHLKVCHDLTAENDCCRTLVAAGRSGPGPLNGHEMRR